jgi:predicted GNAT family acetyltransferase
MELTVVDAPERSRYEARTPDGTVAGVLMYKLSDSLVVVTHTEVDEEWEGQGIGGRLVQGALDDLRRRGVHVLPVCPFTKAWIERHPDYQDLLFGAPPSRVTD